MDSTAENKATDSNASGKLGTWIGIASSIVTVGLTLWNVYTKNQIDKTQQQLQAQEADLHKRAESLEESKERVARYSWVLTQFPNIKDPDAQKRNFTLTLVRMALNESEAKDLFAALAQSNDKSLQEAGQKGLTNLTSEAHTDLVLRINGDGAADRKEATKILCERYRDSSATISAVLRTLDAPFFASLSPPGIINSLYYLARTDPSVWSREQLHSASDIVARLRKKGVGAQTSKELGNLQTNLARAMPAI